ncbi:MAG TPA: DedA family protein [Solirubrobacterales bacterium]|jgi:membrane protein DedA with SNARE-associated domain|nr:DedA family protein [Solirubrobacterales bacterium]
MSAAVAQLGPLGVFLLMVPESAGLPLPSELTLLSAGFGVDQGWFSAPVAVAAATAGNLVGSLIAYWLGRRGVLGKLPGRGGAAVSRCEQLFARRGSSTVFIARLLPLARTFVSLPAGHVGVPLRRFIVLTTAGCAIWSVGFVLAGMLAGSGWAELATTAGRVSATLAGLALVALVSGRRRLLHRR